MTSSPPLEPPAPGETPDAAGSTETGAGSAGPETKWPKWRVSMLVGAIVLLLSAILDAAADDMPRWLYFGIFFVGYVFLAYGFFTALSARKKGSTPRDRG